MNTEANQTTIETTATPPPSNVQIDIVKRAVPRLLPCKLSDEELLRIARMRTTKENEHDQLVAEAELDAKKRKAQIKEYADEIMAMRRELHSGYQDRTVKTNEVFEKDSQGNCWIVVYRLDTNVPTGERWPATAAEMQRHLPVEGGSLLDQAVKVQRSAQTETAPTPEAEVPADLPAADDDVPDDESDEDDEKPAGKKRGAKKGR